MILAFLGSPRTATTSLWKTLSKHKEITGSIIKEPFNDSIKKVIFPISYLNEFKITEDTKVLLDGTPAAYHFFYDKVSKIEMPIRIIYPMRDQYDRIYSTIKQMVITYSKWKKYPNPHPFMERRYEIDIEKLKHVVPAMLDYENLKNAYRVTNDVLIVKWEDLNIWDICEFLGVEPIDIELPKQNSMIETWNSSHSKKAKEQLDNFFHNNKKLDYLIKEDRRKVYENFNYS